MAATAIEELRLSQPGEDAVQPAASPIRDAWIISLVATAELIWFAALVYVVRLLF